MKHIAKWKVLILTAGLLPAFGLSCSTTDVRDAALAGLLDFLSGTITDSLTALLPIADTISGA